MQNGTRRQVELTDGQIEVLPTPKPFHQRIAQYLFRLLEACVIAVGSGEVFMAPLPIRLWAGKYRDPDVSYFKPGRITNPHRQPEGADLVIEIVSDGEEDRQRDLGDESAVNMPKRASPSIGSSIHRRKRSVS